MTKRYFKGARGSVAGSALEFCQVCGSQAAAHQRDIESGRDRLVCPTRDADGDIITSGEIVARPWFDPADRLDRAMEVAQAMIPQMPRMTIPDAVRASAGPKINAIENRMRQLKLTRDEQRELRRRAQLAQIAQDQRAQLEQQRLYAKVQFTGVEIKQSAERVGEMIYFLPAGRMTGMTDQATEPAKPAKKEPSVAVAPSRAYFED